MGRTAALPAGPRVELGFRDGSTAELDAGCEQAVALQVLARTLSARTLTARPLTART